MIFIKINSVIVRIETNCNELKKDIKKIYSGFVIQPPQNFYGKIVNFTLLERNKIWKLYHGEKKLLTFYDYSHIFPNLEWYINTTIYRLFNKYIQIHGAGLTKGDKSILILGKSGSGKSTAALKLVKNGYDIFAEDMIILDCKRDKIIPYFKPISIKGVVRGNLKKHLNNKRAVSGLNDHYHYVSPENVRKGSIGTPKRVGKIIFLYKKKVGRLKITKIDFKRGIDTFFNFITNRSNYNAIELRAIVRLCRDAVFYNVSWSNNINFSAVMKN